MEIIYENLEGDMSFKPEKHYTREQLSDLGITETMLILLGDPWLISENVEYWSRKKTDQWILENKKILSLSDEELLEYIYEWRASNGHLNDEELEERARMLWNRFKNKYATEDIAIAKMIYYLNKSIKCWEIPKCYYEFKNQWISNNSEYLTKGLFVRNEIDFKLCDYYEDYEDYEEDCEKYIENDCEGCPWIKYKKLYVHYFNIDGESFCFHSYTEPKNIITEEIGEDQDEYGKKYSKKEIEDEIGFTMAEIMDIFDLGIIQI